MTEFVSGSRRDFCIGFLVSLTKELCPLRPLADAWGFGFVTVCWGGTGGVRGCCFCIFSLFCSFAGAPVGTLGSVGF